jgi:poly(3-hydroxybutyrate) depolymerase
VPENYRADTPHGIVVWLSADGAYEAESLVARWKPWCDGNGLILVAPQTVEPSDPKDKRRWNPATDTTYLAKVLDQVRQNYNVDPARVVVQGYQGGGAMAFVLAFNQREWIRGVVAVEAPLAGKPVEHEPIYPLSIYVARASGTVAGNLIAATAKRLGDMKYPVTVKDTGSEPHDLGEAEQAEVLRWIDTLDRI